MFNKRIASGRGFIRPRGRAVVIVLAPVEVSRTGRGRDRVVMYVVWSDSACLKICVIAFCARVLRVDNIYIYARVA